MFLEIDEWTIEWDREENLWLVYPTEEVGHNCNIKYFSSEREAIEFAESHNYDEMEGR